MSRREDRISDGRRHRSRIEREPSPKRSRRDVKVESERPPAETTDRDRDTDQRYPRRLRDALPLETPLTVSKDTDNKINGAQEGTKRTSDQTKVPHSRSHFQHDERASVGRNGRGPIRRTDNESGWWRDSKDRQNSKMRGSYFKTEQAKDSRDEKRVWRHDGYFQMEAEKKHPLLKRPAFREQKPSTDHEKTEETARIPTVPKVQDNAGDGGKRDVSRFASERLERLDRAYARDRELSKAETRSNNARDRFGGSVGGSRYRRGGEGFNGMQGYHHPPVGARVEKWKHDLYEESNRSPSPKNDEDQISKIEALLAS